MNTNKLESFAQAARIKLIDQISRKLEFVLNNTSQSFIDTYTSQLSSLNDKIKQTSREQVIETVAYTWFNRLMALRFMDANGYTLPKVITPLPGMSNPEILQNALAGHIEADMHLDRQRLNDLLDGRTASADAHTEAYKMLIVAACNQWYTAMPFMFERISDYTELLLPDDLLSDYSIVADIRNGMTDEDCQQEEILGWLYQFYISAENERLIKSKKAYAKHELAPASQLFTPKWIVKYMVDNTLGQLWSEMNPSTSILRQLEFYITPAYKDQLTPRTKKKLEEIKFFDPCVGSGHILVYAFDVFYLMYEEQGYNSSEIPELIIKHNLFGTDIDERAAQIAAFVLTMKGRRKNSRFLKKNITPNVTFYQDFEEDTKFSNAKTIGSLINVEPEEMKAFKVETGSIYAEQQLKLKQLYTFLGQRYDCVVTNPPYIPSSRFENDLKTYINQKYPDLKSDLFACFMQRVTELTVEDGFIGYICPFVWMFISSFEKLREFVIDNTSINSLIQLEYNAFEPACVPIATFTLQNKKHDNYKGSYVRLVDFKGHENQAPRTLEAIQNTDCGWFYTANQNDFEKIPGSPIGYWISAKILKVFEYKPLHKIAVPRAGMITGNNSIFLRLWQEVSFNKFSSNCTTINESVISKRKWFPYQKGGSFHKWFGNNEYVVNYENNGWLLKNTKDLKGKVPAHAFNEEYIFKANVNWSALTAGKFSTRITKFGSLFDAAGSAAFPIDVENVYCISALLNSKLTNFILGIINPTLNFQAWQIGNLTLSDSVIHNSIVINKAKENYHYSRLDWDSHETSWDYQQNELIKQQTESIKTAFVSYKKEWVDKFYKLHRNEEELNRQFIEIYGLQDELTPDVPLEEITILQEEGKIIDGQLEIQTAPVMLQLISYAVGCMFGRYSLDKPGLILANHGDTLQDYTEKVQAPTFTPDEDNIIPVLEGEWFSDDIVGRFREFIKVAFSAEQLNENIGFIEDNIPVKDIRRYFVKDFYNDHIKRYKKRPIYWMFSSPKGHFKALIYMHRYQSDTCSKLLNDYLQPFISKLEAAKHTQTMFSLRVDISGQEKIKATKDIEKFDVMLKDSRNYERTLFTIATQKTNMDLDDGVKVNYQKFKDVLVPIKELEKEE
jgi:type II restriction/modification system DNA methylase subunit YeeA